MENKRLLLVANDATNLQTAKRPTMAERIDGFQHAGFATAVGTYPKVKAGRSGEIRGFNVAEIADQQAGEGHYSLIGMST